MEIQTFYNGLCIPPQDLVDAIADGSLNNKTPEEFRKLLRLNASNHYQKSTERSHKTRGILEIDTTTTILTKMENSNSQAKKSQLEEMFQQFMKTHTSIVEKTKTQFKHHEASTRNIENQVGQISQQLTQRLQGSLPSNTIKNSKEYVKTNTRRSGKELADPEKQVAKKSTAESDNPNSTMKKYEIPMKRDQKLDDQGSTYVPPPAYNSPLPYPQRVQQQNKMKQQKQYNKFF
ncbi:hypothetical protein PIB30_016295 [Stylosanthes scabra]|uniref:Uncharacterized protein n=1 Tax=Stylosanthes scabra TaxID=79078 RepID=A0ABU6Q7C7_9FABA|nr:hypothetical protein [Stylosanthes scabra]